MFDLILVAVGLLPAVPVYFVSRKVFDKRFEQQKHVPALTQTTEPKKSKNKQKALQVSVITENNKRWEKRPSAFPLVIGGKKVLKTISALSALHLSVEDQHNLEVLSNQTDALLNTFVTTPESISAMPEVQRELEAQLVEIVKGVDNIHAQGAENLLRELKTGTDFLRAKFNQGENLQTIDDSTPQG